jgi:hypothetical protein
MCACESEHKHKGWWAMPRGTEVPEETMQRMLSYLRELDCMMRAGEHQFSSQSLAQSLHMNPAQIRKTEVHPSSWTRWGQD